MSLLDVVVACFLIILLFSAALSALSAAMVVFNPGIKEDALSKLKACVEEGECPVTDSNFHIWRERLTWNFIKKGESPVRLFMGYFLTAFFVILIELPVECFKVLWKNVRRA